MNNLADTPLSLLKNNALMAESVFQDDRYQLRFVDGRSEQNVTFRGSTGQEYYRDSIILTDLMGLEAVKLLFCSDNKKLRTASWLIPTAVSQKSFSLFGDGSLSSSLQKSRFDLAFDQCYKVEFDDLSIPKKIPKITVAGNCVQGVPDAKPWPADFSIDNYYPLLDEQVLMPLIKDFLLLHDDQKLTEAKRQQKDLMLSYLDANIAQPPPPNLTQKRIHKI